jgi:hypothetical protein
MAKGGRAFRARARLFCGQGSLVRCQGAEQTVLLLIEAGGQLQRLRAGDCAATRSQGPQRAKLYSLVVRVFIQSINLPVSGSQALIFLSRHN